MLSPENLWAAIEHFDSYSRWWSWLHEFRVLGDGLETGSVLYGVVVPPLPYRMRIQVEILDSVRFLSIDAAVHGDLEGVAQLRMSPTPSGSKITIGWKVEMMQSPMRLASRFAHPLLRWGHDRVVEITVASFRRNIERDYAEAPDASPFDRLGKSRDGERCGEEHD